MKLIFGADGAFRWEAVTALACNPTLAEPPLVTDAEFIDAEGTFEAAAPGSFARLGAYDKMLRVEGAANAFTMGKVATDWSQGCFSTYKPPEAGCNPAYFVSVRGGLVTFRQDTNTGQFRRGDGGFFGTIELRYGGPVYTVPAELVLQ